VSFAGNVNASNFVGNFVGNIGNANYANYAGTVLTNSQPNITSIGTLTSLNVTNKIIAGQLQGDGGNISNIQGANVSGQTGNALVAGTVYTNAQPNITSVGTLSSLIVSGNTQSNNFIANRLYQYGTNQLLIDGAGNANFTALTVSSQNVTIGSNAGSNSQGQFAIAIGNGAGKNSQGNYSIAIGSNAGISGQHDNTIILNATGLNLFSQLANSTYIAPIRQFTGPNVLYFSPSTKEITYGPIPTGNGNAGSTISNGTSNVNIATANGNITFGVAGSANVMVVTGTEANVNVLRTRETRVVLGNNAGSGLSFSSNSAVGVVLIGDSAGIGSGGTISNTAIAVGSNAGAGGFGQFDGIAIGANAGSLGNTLSAAQGNAIAIGVNAGQGALNSDTIAIGRNSGYRLQNYSIAIGSGAGNTQPGNNTIILNATGSNLTQTTANSLTIKPIRNARNDQTLVYDPTSGEVTYTNYVKTISTTVASLVAANTVGAGTRAFVTDANTTTFLAIVGGGGANKVPVVSDGTNWIVG
jgi:hypothetical protein